LICAAEKASETFVKTQNYQELRSHLSTNLQDFTFYFKDQLKISSNKQILSQHDQLITIFQGWIEILDHFTKNQIFGLDNFEYLSLPKYTLEALKEDFLDKKLSFLDKTTSQASSLLMNS
jgi:hypothetical protein